MRRLLDLCDKKTTKIEELNNQISALREENKRLMVEISKCPTTSGR